MERRHRQRTATAIHTVIHRRGTAHTSGNLRNLSLDGACIETGGVIARPGAGVEIEFVEGVLADLRLRALVVHASDQGFGVMFFDSDAATRYALKATVAYWSICDCAP